MLSPKPRRLLQSYCLIIPSLFLANCVEGAEPSADKSQYNLFNPTPRELMREMSTDRPDKTESAYTVDAGHFQFEMDILNYAYDRHNADRSNTRVETVSIAPVNLKLGLLNNVDLQLVLETYTSVRTHDRTLRTVEKNRGFGDMVVRTKFNLWGNDGGTTALALMPYVKLPTNQDDLGNNSVEGGLIVPLGVALPRDWGMGVMTQIDVIRDGVGGGHHAEFVNTITFAHDIVGNLGGYLEFFSAVSTESGSDWIGTFDAGFTYALTEDIQLDAGINIGVTRSADDWNPFIGLSWRF
ncbi:MAG: transporter [Verrucomicrobia bacterium]|nr:transporter [Verrucomicrobiota bacterium]